MSNNSKNNNLKYKSKGNGEGTIYLNKIKNILVGQYTINGKRKSVYQRKRKENRL